MYLKRPLADPLASRAVGDPVATPINPNPNGAAGEAGGLLDMPTENCLATGYICCIQT